MTRDEKQKECFLAWRQSGGRATVVGATGFGKTRIALNTITAFRTKNNQSKVIIIVPTAPLKDKWIEDLSKSKLLTNSKVMICDSAVGKRLQCDLLVMDEIHNYASEENISLFKNIEYKFILGLTATFERIDKRHKLIEAYAPVCIEVPLRECLRNNWVSDYVEYKVKIYVDISEYMEWKKSMLESLAFFDNNLQLALDIVNPKFIGKKIKFMRDTGYSEKEVIVPAMNVVRKLKKTNTFVMEHPKKVELANKIIEKRSNKKIITFSQRSVTALGIKTGDTIHSKISKKKRALAIESFKKAEKGVLNTVKVLDEGEDIDGVNCAIILCNSSAQRQKVQRLGRSIRFQEGKKTEVFTFVLAGTSEENWFKNSNVGAKEYIEIDEKDLDLVLDGDSQIDKLQEDNNLFNFIML